MEKEFNRLFFSKEENKKKWNLSSLNQDFKLCSTYPKTWVLPSGASDKLIQKVTKFRSKGRIPVTCYLYTNDTPMFRCSQPLVGLTANRSTDDEEYLEILANTKDQPKEKKNKLYIIDARPKANAVGNKLRGAGYENVGKGGNYSTSVLEFVNIANIHAMRSSIQTLQKFCMEKGEYEESLWFSNIESSGWFDYVSKVLAGSVRVATLIQEGYPTLVHCSDGWDRTSQLTSLAQIMLDPYYRTIEGFFVLIEKEWTFLGHKFAQRYGHGKYAKNFKDSQRSPIFIQFIDCLWQITQQFPTSFEYNEKFLIAVCDSVFSNLFGNFLGESDKERIKMDSYKNTCSLWSYLYSEKLFFSNPLYVHEDDHSGVILPKSNKHIVRLWQSYFLRFLPNKFVSFEGIDHKLSNCVLFPVQLDVNLDKVQVELLHKRSNVDVGNVQSLLKEKSPIVTTGNIRTSQRNFSNSDKNAFEKFDKKGELFRSNSSSKLNVEIFKNGNNNDTLNTNRTNEFITKRNIPTKLPSRGEFNSSPIFDKDDNKRGSNGNKNNQSSENVIHYEDDDGIGELKPTKVVNFHLNEKDDQSDD